MTNKELKQTIKEYQKQSKLREKEYLKEEKIKEQNRRNKLQDIFDKIIIGEKLTDSQMSKFENLYRNLTKEE